MLFSLKYEMKVSKVLNIKNYLHKFISDARKSHKCTKTLSFKSKKLYSYPAFSYLFFSFSFQVMKYSTHRFSHYPKWIDTRVEFTFAMPIMGSVNQLHLKWCYMFSVSTMLLYHILYSLHQQEVCMYLCCTSLALHIFCSND